MCVVFVHTYLPECVCSCVPIAVGMFACSGGSTALDFAETEIPRPHSDPRPQKYSSWAEEACSGHCSPTCFSHGRRPGRGVVGWGGLNPGPASAPHLLCLQKATVVSLGSRKWEQRYKPRGS